MPEKDTEPRRPFDSSTTVAAALLQERGPLPLALVTDIVGAIASQFTTLAAEGKVHCTAS